MLSIGCVKSISSEKIDPIKACEAVMDGYEVMKMADAAKIGDIFVTVTGCRDVITMEHILTMKDGAILTNAGHFNVEVNMEELEKAAVKKVERRDNIVGYVLANGKSVNVIGEGRLVNLAAGDGHPAEIMDMSFAIQSLCAAYLAGHREKREPGNMTITVPPEIDRMVAERKLAAMGYEIDTLTDVQKAYLGSWEV